MKKKTGTVKAAKAASKVVRKKTKPVKAAASKKPVVSVVMPVFNGAAFIDDTIHSVLGQTFEDFELIVVDDASTDKTLEVVGQFGDARIRVIACKRNGGAAKARNRGVKAARGRYIAFIDADDLWQPSKLLRQVQFMEEKDCAFSFGSYVFADAKGRPNGKVVRVPSEINSAPRSSVILISTVVVDTKKFSKGSLKFSDDTKETWQTILEKTGKACGLDSVVAIRRGERKSFWAKIWRRG